MCQLRSKNQFMTKHKFFSRHTSNMVQHQNNSKTQNQSRSRNQTKGNLRTHHTQVVYMSQHDLAYKNSFPATNLEKGWIIDSGASAHMTPFRKDCQDIQKTHRVIYLTDDSTVLWEMFTSQYAKNDQK